MPTWRVLLVLFLGCVCMVSASATIVVPMTDGAGDQRWLWFAGLLVATAGMGAVLVLFLKNSDRAMDMKTP